MRTVVTRQDYFAAALDVLADRGHSALRIGVLCTAVGVTQGSFYHYFGSWDGFVHELLSDWEKTRFQRIVAITSAEPDAHARVHTIKALATGLPHESEAAIRSWAQINPMVAVVQRRVDAERLHALQSVVAQVVADSEQALRLAEMGMALLIGMQQWRRPLDPGDLARVLDDFESLVVIRATGSANVEV